jgi:DNA-binding transcriptional MerR regulator
MHGDGTRYSIGELARRTGLSVRTVRFYSDSGVVPPAGRTEAGYRVYDGEALARLELVRTLRELGVDLATIRRVLARELRVPEVAAAHAAALDAQIRTLRLRRAVLRVIAARIRQMSERHAADRAADGTLTGEPAALQRVAALVAERAGAALEAGIDPASDEARPIAGELAAAFAEAEGRGGESGPPAALADRLATGTDARAERYWQLLAVINGCPPIPTTVPAWEWLIAALRAREA